MGRLNLRPTAKTSKPVDVQAEPIDTPVRGRAKPKKTASADKAVRPEMNGAKLVMGVGIAGTAASLICLVVFFQSDIPTKIVSAKSAEAAQVYATANTTPELATDDDYSLGEVADSSAGADGQDGQDAAGKPDIVIAPGAVISSEDLAGHLQEMSTDDFTELAESIDQLIVSDPTLVNLPERKSLAEAYAEAESKYPGQIDGSKRLKLVDELNAIDYTYYVAEDGDTLLELSKSFGVPLGQMVEINGIHEADYIKAGAILLLPSETVQPE